MSFIRTLLWGDENEADQAFEDSSFAEEENVPTWTNETEEDAAGEAVESIEPQMVSSGYDPERSIRQTLEREAAEVRVRDELTVRVGRLSLALESMIRLLQDKQIISDLDLRRMKQLVDLEDGHADGEFHPGFSPVPSHCPKCEARIPSGKRLCQLCGHSFPAE